MIAFVDLKPAADAADVRAAVDRVLQRGWFILGPELDAFETEFAAASGASHAIGVGTGTDALAIALRALDIGPGDEVITSPLSTAYTALAIMMVGARPVFADIDPARLTLDPRTASAAITPKTRALLPVHLYGQAADMPALMALAKRHGLAVVEDCCQAHLATCEGRPVGSFGEAAAYSFYPTKNLGALGDGGAITTANEQLAQRMRRLRNGGQTDRYRHQEFGVNSRLDELQAAVLRARLRWLPEWTSQLLPGRRGTNRGELHALCAEPRSASGSSRRCGQPAGQRAAAQAARRVRRLAGDRHGLAARPLHVGGCAPPRPGPARRRSARARRQSPAAPSCRPVTVSASSLSRRCSLTTADAWGHASPRITIAGAAWPSTESMARGFGSPTAPKMTAPSDAPSDEPWPRRLSAGADRGSHGAAQSPPGRLGAGLLLEGEVHSGRRSLWPKLPDRLAHHRRPGLPVLPSAPRDRPGLGPPLAHPARRPTSNGV